MSTSDRTSSAAASGNWLVNQPYLLLCIAALCWAGNAIVGRLAAGHIPPVTLSFLRWSFAFLIILPFAWKHLKRDWGAIRARLGTMIFLSVIGISGESEISSVTPSKSGPTRRIASTPCWRRRSDSPRPRDRHRGTPSWRVRSPHSRSRARC